MVTDNEIYKSSYHSSAAASAGMRPWVINIPDRKLWLVGFGRTCGYRGDMSRWISLASCGAFAASLVMLVSGPAMQESKSSRTVVSLNERPAAADPKCPSGDAGISVAISGSVALIGDWHGNNFRGATCVYTETGNAWRLTSVLTDPRNKEWDGFGFTVGVSSTRAATYAIVSAPGDGESVGIVYIYVRSGNRWRMQAKLSDPGKGMTDNFGQSVAISGTTAVVGADYSVASKPGFVYVYVKSGRSWRLQATLTDPSPTQTFGSDVAISGSTIIVGDGEQPSPSVVPEIRHAVAPAVTSVFTRTHSKWRLQAKLTNSYPGAVAISGNLALVGEESQGDARLFGRTGSRWRRLAVLRGPFGNSVAITANAAVIGGPYADGGCGAAYVYEGSGTKWRLRVKLVPPRCPRNTLELFAWSVAAGGKTAVIGQGYGGAYVMNFP